MSKDSGEEGSFCTQLLDEFKKSPCLTGLIIALALLALFFSWLTSSFLEIFTFVGGVILIGLASIRSKAMLQNARLTNKIQKNEKFHNNVKLLQEIEKVDIEQRGINEPIFFGAVHGLDSLARDGDEYADPVRDVLASLSRSLLKEPYADTFPGRNEHDMLARCNCYSHLINRLYGADSPYDMSGYGMDSMNLEKLRLTDVKFENNFFRNTTFTKCDFSCASAINSELGSGCVLRKCVADVNVDKCMISHSRFDEADLLDSSVQASDIKSCVFEYCKLPCDFKQCRISSVVVFRCRCNSKFTASTISDSKFSEVDFTLASFHDTTFQNCKFVNCTVTEEFKQEQMEKGNHFE